MLHSGCFPFLIPGLLSQLLSQEERLSLREGPSLPPPLGKGSSAVPGQGISSALCLEAQGLFKVGFVLAEKLLEGTESTEGEFVDLGEFLSELKLQLGPEPGPAPGHPREPCSMGDFQLLGKVVLMPFWFKLTELASSFLLGEMTRQGRRKKTIFSHKQ